MRNSFRLLIVAALMMAASAVATASDVREFTSSSLQHIVTENKGKPFVLVVWSLDCVYCQTSMETIAAERRRGKSIRVVTLSTDFAGDAPLMEQAVKRLQAQGLADSAWAFGDEVPERLRYALDPKWHGEKPRTYWFNAKGERTAYSGVVSPAHIAKFLAQR